MTAKIVDLRNYRSTVRSTQGIPFPQVFRLKGFYYDVDDGNLETSDRPSSVLYTLSKEDAGGLANTSHDPINLFDPLIDIGWLFVRHHMTETGADGYMDAHMDYICDEESSVSGVMFRTKEGIFTLHHRKANKDAPDHLIVYISKRPDAGAPQIGIGPGMIDEYKIYHSDGTITDDPDLLFPMYNEKEK